MKGISLALIAAFKLLKELHSKDPEAIGKLLNIRVPCNEHTADHYTVQVGITDDGGTRLGVLGLLNGLSDDPNIVIMVDTDENDHNKILEIHLYDYDNQRILVEGVDYEQQ